MAASDTYRERQREKERDTERQRREIAKGKCLESGWVVFNCFFISNKGPSHTLKGRTFFLITFAKKFIMQIT